MRDPPRIIIDGCVRLCAPEETVPELESMPRRARCLATPGETSEIKHQPVALGPGHAGGLHASFTGCLAQNHVPVIDLALHDPAGTGAAESLLADGVHREPVFPQHVEQRAPGGHVQRVSGTGRDETSNDQSSSVVADSRGRWLC